MKQRIKVANKDDREAVAVILIRNGYRVGIVAVKNVAMKNEYYVEYEEARKND
jgi:hypothetical protein